MSALGYTDNAHSDFGAYANTTERDEAIQAGAGTIDAALEAAGYQAPVVLTDLAAGDARTRLTARFDVWNRALALGYLSSGQTGTSSKIDGDRELAESALERIRKGEETLPLIPRASLRRVRTRRMA